MRKGEEGKKGGGGRKEEEEGVKRQKNWQESNLTFDG